MPIELIQQLCAGIHKQIAPSAFVARSAGFVPPDFDTRRKDSGEHEQPSSLFDTSLFKPPS
jgi:hypothetical protein